jgi:hypothetical protein
MELYEKRVFGGGAMLRDACTAGFEVMLDDGRILKIPAGRVRILGKRERVDTDSAKIEDFVQSIDPERDQAPRPRFPYDFARAVTIDPGDRVEILGDVEIAADATSTSGYRANAAFVTPMGVPVLRVRKAAKAAPEGHVRIAADPTAATSSADEQLVGTTLAEEEADDVDVESERQRRQQEMRR